MRCGSVCPEDRLLLGWGEKQRVCSRRHGHAGPHRSKDREWGQVNAPYSVERRRGVKPQLSQPFNTELFQ
jgi:hypothetical protein